MQIRLAVSADRDALLDLWERSVRATHAFLSEADIVTLTPQVRDYLASDATTFWVLCRDDGTIMGFMGLAGGTAAGAPGKMGSLFLAPEFQGQGGGRRLVEHARSLCGELTVDVNEQNTAARAFYESCGFVVEGRSPLDDQGRPYPLLHLRLTTPG